MKKEVVKLWNTIQRLNEQPLLTSYIPDNKKSNAALVIFAGGAYDHRALHEGHGYGEFFANCGIPSFVVDYSVKPNDYKAIILDARRAVQIVRYNAEKYGIDKSKIAVVGSSAGGHLAALISIYHENVDGGETDCISKESFIPNAQILCYPGIKLLGDFANIVVGRNFLGDKQYELGNLLSPDLTVQNDAPQAFIWHAVDDDTVDVMNSIDYAKMLKLQGVNVELHLFPKGGHGVGLAQKDDKDSKHISVWSDLLLRWLKYIDFLD